MAKSIGIDAGDHSVKVVEIDGSYRKTRLLRCRVETVPAAPDGAERAAATASAITTAMKAGKIGGDAVLGHPSREAVLRTIDVPFTGRDAIRKVIKAEVEGAIQSQSVDEMVVDFLEVGKAAEGSKVLVAAIPKQGLREVLDALVDSGIEPEHVDLDAMAVYRTADWCGAFVPPASAPVPPDADAEPPSTTNIVLDLGARSTRVLVVTDGKLVDMRTIRLGDASIAEGVMRANSLSLDDARAAVQACLTTGADWSGEVAEALPAAVAGQAAAGEEAAPPKMRTVAVAAAQVEAEQDAYLQRLSRELVRFLASNSRLGSIHAVWITGGGSRIAGMKGMLEGVFGRAPHELDVLGRLQHSLSPEEAETLGPRLATAIGLALQPFGGPDGFELRQEDLAYTRGFDRVKFPLAITCMVALFTAVVYGVKLNNDLKNLQYQIGTEYRDPQKGTYTFYGQLCAVFESGWFSNFSVLEGKKEYREKDLRADLVLQPVANRVKFVLDKLTLMLKQQREKSGVYDDLSVDSGLAVLVRFFEVLKKAEDGDLGSKYLLCKFDLNMKSSGAGDKSGRALNFTIAIRDADRTARARKDALQSEIEAECKQPDSPFSRLDALATRENPFADAAETKTTGTYFDMKILIKDQFNAFGGAKQ
jgi:type IV pilus assembly protein PilM